MKKIIILIMILFTTAIYSKEAKIIGSRVNIRSKASLKSKTIGRLNKNAKIIVIKEIGKDKVLGKYFGKWLKIKFNRYKNGYVFSSFVKRGKKDDEKFHIFIGKFMKIHKNKNINFVKSRIKFPIQVDKCFEGECQEKTYNKSNFKKSAIQLKGPYMYKPRLTYKKNMIEYSFRTEGSSATMFFKLIKNKWYLVKVTFSSC